jgi:protein involved in polysaccharide export with SLBB domain
MSFVEKNTQGFTFTVTQEDQAMNVAKQMRNASKKSMTGNAVMGVLLAIAAISSTGCTSILSPIRGIPVRMTPPQFLWRPRSTMIPLELYRLTRKQPKEYELDAGDLLAFYIEGVTGEPDAVVPTHFPEQGSDLAPVTGYPFPIRDDGTISLPLIPAIDARGMTLTKLEERVREEYTVKRKILQPGRDRITIGLIKERTTRVIVVRSDQQVDSGATTQNSMQARRVIQGADESGKGFVIDLKAYKNDLMNALAESGGLPGLSAKNEVKILRRAKADPEKREQFVRDFYAQHSLDPCICPPPLPEDPSTTVIPLRFYPEEMPDIREEDIILYEGDIVYIESREAELFYTGGMLPGGQWPLPRDYDLDAIGAMGVAGFGAGSTQASNGGGGGGMLGGAAGLGGAAPSNLFIVRKTPCNQQITIKVDTLRALQDPRENILIAPGDTLILRYKPREELLNFSIAAFFTYGIAYFFNRSN